MKTIQLSRNDADRRMKVNREARRSPQNPEDQATAKIGTLALWKMGKHFQYSGREERTADDYESLKIVSASSNDSMTRHSA
jgi:hypothetical protein